MMREEIKRRIHEVENELKALKELVDSDAFAPVKEPELTEFEAELSDIVEYCKKHGEKVAKDYALRHAKPLLELALKEALKDIPKWKKADGGKKYPSHIVREKDGNGDYWYRLSVGKIYDGYEYILISEFDKLPHEEC